MSRGKIVLDTNCLIASLSRRGEFFRVWRYFMEGRYLLCYSNEILTEYEEILAQHATPEIAENVVQAIVQSRHAVKIDPYFHFGLIKADPDDNKFADCAVAANASYIVSDDSHFNELGEYFFPRLDVLKLREFLRLLEREV